MVIADDFFRPSVGISWLIGLERKHLRLRCDFREPSVLCTNDIQ